MHLMSLRRTKNLLWVLLGAECTGKSTLARAFAAQNPGWLCVDEYLREFCDQHQRLPTRDEQAGIAAEQQRRIEQARLQAHVIADTHAFQTAVYSSILLGDDSLLVDTANALCAADAVFLCAPDFAAVGSDWMRDGEATRTRVHRELVTQLTQFGIRFFCLHGTWSGRLRELSGVDIPQMEDVKR
jgi:nicotinamide riboside kinase